MIFRFPTINDKEILEDYVQKHYENNEKNIHASNMLTSLDYNSWVKKYKIMLKFQTKIRENL